MRPQSPGLDKDQQRRTSEALPSLNVQTQCGTGDDRRGGKDLSREDLLFLLCMMEGELQARDEAGTVLEAERLQVATLEAHYGFGGPQEVLHALQRDSLQAQVRQHEDVYVKPMAELDRVVGTQRRCVGQMLEQLEVLERSHSGALGRLEEQEDQHRVFIQKSDELTALLEQDRERLKIQLVQERDIREGKEEVSKREVSALKEELTKLQFCALLAVQEQRRLTDQLTVQSQRVQELTAISDHAQWELNFVHSRVKEDDLKTLHLQEKLGDEAPVFRLSQEVMTAKLSDEDTQKQQLRQRLASLSRQLDDLEGTRGALRRAEEELQELRDRVGRSGGEEGGGGEGGVGSPSLLSEVETLRKRLARMEEKDEELIRLGDRCRDLDHKLGRESSQSRSLKAEVDRLNGRISELDRLEEALGKSRHECSGLKGSLEREKGVGVELAGELDTLKFRVKELEAFEGQLEKTEGALRQDLAKLRALTAVLVEDRKTMAQKLKQTEEKLGRTEGKQQKSGPNRMAPSHTDRSGEEMTQELRLKNELEVKLKNVERERDELKVRLATEEGRSEELQSKVHTMRKRLQALEGCVDKEEKKAKDRHVHNPLPDNDNDNNNNKVRELIQEAETLRRRLAQKELVEVELRKAEGDYQSLDRRCRMEQEKSRALTVEVEEAKRELSRFQLVEKQESNQEHLLLRRLQEEQVKSRLLGREVETLREKVQRLTGTKESISRVQLDHSVLQRKLSQQEGRNRDLGREMEVLTIELERYRHFSKSLRPGVNGRRFTDLHLSNKEVQTEEADRLPPDYRSLASSSAQNQKLQAERAQPASRYKDPVKNKRLSPLNNSDCLNIVNNNVRRYSIPSPCSPDRPHVANSEALNSNLGKKGDVVLTHTPGQPVHIKVMPDHGHNTATLEISSPTAESTTSYTSTAVIPTSGGASPKQRITIIQNSVVSPVRSNTSPSSPERALSPLTMSPVSRVVRPNCLRSAAPDSTNSPLQIVTVSTGSPEPAEVRGEVAFQMSPEGHNGWHVHRSNSTGPSVITTEDNKIHIHLGSPYIKTLNGIVHGPSQPSGLHYSPGKAPRTQVLTNGCHVKGGGKITSSITIAPATSPVSDPSNTTFPPEGFKKQGPTRIPKPKGNSFQGVANRVNNNGQNIGKSLLLHNGRRTGLRLPTKTSATTTTTG